MSLSPMRLLDLPGHRAWAGDSIGGRLQKVAREHGERLALGGVDRPWNTHASFAALVAERASELRRFGLGRGDVVLLCLPNGPEALAAFLSLASVVTVLPLALEDPVEAINALIERLPVKAILFDPSRPGGVRGVRPGSWRPLPVRILPDAPAGSWEFVETAARDVTVPPSIEVFDAAVLVRTAGSTAEPKLVAWSQASILASADVFGRWADLGPGDRSLCMMPFSHLHSVVRSTLPGLLSGGSAWCAPGFDRTQVRLWLEAVAPTYITGVPAIFRTLLERLGADSGRALVPLLRLLASGSDAIDSGTVKALRAAFEVPVREFYGMSEVAPMLAGTPSDGEAQTGGSVGEVIPPWRVSCQDETGRALPPGEEGEIVACGGLLNPVISGGSPTAPPNDPGCYRTGDLGWVDSEGRVYITGRVDNRINRGGKKISPETVEALLATLPEIAQVAVFPLPDTVLGQRIGAAVVAAPGHSLKAGRVRGVVAEQLADYMAPDAVFFVEEIPTNRAGKLSRHALGAHFGETVGATDLPAEPSTASSAQLELEMSLEALFAQSLELSEIDREKAFMELGGDSFQATVMLAEIEEAHGVLLTPAEFLEHSSVRELAALLALRTGVAEVESEPPENALEVSLEALFAQSLELSEIDREKAFMELGGDSFQATVMLAEIEEAHGVLLTPAEFLEHSSVRELAALLAARIDAVGEPAASKQGERETEDISLVKAGNGRCPIIFAHSVEGYANYAPSFGRYLREDQTVFAMRWRKPETQAHATMESYAAAFVSQIERIVPEGPFSLIGHSFGAHLAFEVAQQLEARGRRPASVLLLDDEADLHKRRFGQRQKAVSAVDEIRTQCEHLLYGYLPRPYRGRLDVVRAEFDVTDMLADPFGGWLELALGPCKRHSIASGSHNEMITEEHIARWSGGLQAIIDTGFAANDSPDSEEIHSDVSAAVTRFHDARLAGKEGDRVQEIAFYEATLEEYGDSPPYWALRNFAEALWQAGEHDRALVAYEAARKREAVPLVGSRILAGRLRELGRENEAQVLFEEIVAGVSLDSPLALLGLAEWLLEEGREGEAEDYLSRLHELQPKNPLAREPLSRLLHERGAHVEALAMIDGLERAPGVMTTTLVRHARLLQLNGQRDAAEKAYRRAIERIRVMLPLSAFPLQERLILAVLWSEIGEEVHADAEMGRVLEGFTSEEEGTRLLLRVWKRGPFTRGSLARLQLRTLQLLGRVTLVRSLIRRMAARSMRSL